MKAKAHCLCYQKLAPSGQFSFLAAGVGHVNTKMRQELPVRPERNVRKDNYLQTAA